MMPWDVPGGIVGCYMRYGSGDRAIKRMGQKKQSIKKMGTEKELQGSWTGSCLCFSLCVTLYKLPHQLANPRGRTPF